MGVPEATGRSRASDGAPQPPRARPAEARRVSALPRAEAAAPCLPDVRLVRRPPWRSSRRPTSGDIRRPRPGGAVSAARRAGERPPDPGRRRRDGRRPRSRPRSSPARSSYAATHPDDASSSSATAGAIAPHAGRDLPRQRHRWCHASQVIDMDEHPALALREKRDASILVATDLVRDGRGRRRRDGRSHRRRDGRRGPPPGSPARGRPAGARRAR